MSWTTAQIIELAEMAVADPPSWPVFGDAVREWAWTPSTEELVAMFRFINPRGSREVDTSFLYDGAAGAELRAKWWEENRTSPTPTFAKALVRVLNGERP